MPHATSNCPRCGTALDAGTEASTCPRCGADPAGHAHQASGLSRKNPRPVLWVLGASGATILAGALLFLFVIQPAMLPDGKAAPRPPAPLAGAAKRRPDQELARSLMSVTKRGGAAEKGQASVVVALGLAVPPDPKAAAIRPDLLAYEIVRQAVLLTAREEFGALTRDASVGESPPTGAGDPVAVVRSVFMNQGPCEASIRRGDAQDASDLWSARLFTNKTDLDIATIVERTEAVTRKELRDVLRSLGVEGSPIAVVATGALPEDIEKRLNVMTFTEQFAAVRAAHAEARAHGMSPARRGGLIRGYAHLGTLSEFYWNTSHAAYAARALLEAERWVMLAPGSSEALWHRAYARTLAGLHKHALDDLAAAKEKSTSATGRPDWVDLIDARCRFDTEKLVAAKSGPRGQLAMLLAFLTVERSMGTARTIRLGREVLDHNSECYRVHDAMSEHGGVAHLHTATMNGMVAFTREVPRRLQELKGLPPRSAKLVADRAHEGQIATALIEDGGDADAGDLSWSVLGWMMREVRFVQVCKRGCFLRYSLGVPAGDFVDEARPLVANHPLRHFVESFGIDPVRAPALFRAELDAVKIPYLELTEFVYASSYMLVDQRRMTELIELAMRHGDDVYRDIGRLMAQVAPQQKSVVAHLMESVSPYAPAARAVLIMSDWPYAAPHAVEWEAAAGSHPEVLFALGTQHFNEKRYVDARRCLERCLALSPDKQTYEWLASTYRAQGDMKKWQATLDRFLAEKGEYGLDHSAVQVDIANYLMDEKKWDEARPYAEAAAESWAGWAMDSAIRCAEGLKDWRQAELWASRKSQRYPDVSWADWFLVCKRSGHGNLNAAQAFTRKQVEAFGPGSVDDTKFSVAFFHLLDGEPAKALATFRGITSPSLYLNSTLFLALTADTLGDTRTRDESLREAMADPNYAGLDMAPIWTMFREVLNGGDPARVDYGVIDAALAKLREQSRGDAQFQVGWFLLLHGPREKAVDYLKQCTDSPFTYYWYRTTAIDVLRNPPGVLGKPK